MKDLTEIHLCMVGGREVLKSVLYGMDTRSLHGYGEYFRLYIFNDMTGYLFSITGRGKYHIPYFYCSLQLFFT